MGEVTTVGLDIAKSVFQVHGIDAAGAVLGAAEADAITGPALSSRSCRRAWPASRAPRSGMKSMS